MVDRIIRGLPADRFDRKITASRNFQSIGKPIPNAGLLQGVVGVGWGGGAVFVIGVGRLTNVDAPVQYLDLKNKSKAKQKDLAFTQDVNLVGDGGDIFGVTYATREVIGGKGTPSYVAVGSDFGRSTHSKGVILHSQDAINWTQVYSQEPIGGEFSLGTSCWIVVHDGAKFWAGAHESTNDSLFNDPENINEYDFVVTSEDGSSWTIAGQNKINFNDWPNYDQHNGLIVPHLDRHPFTNGQDFGCPGGYFGIRLSADGNTLKTAIRPSADFTVNSLQGIWSSFTPNTTVLRNGTSVEVGIPVSCVGYSNGIWMAGGGNFLEGESCQAAVSADDGQTWQSVQVTGQGSVAVGIAGGPFNLVR